jgi:hypothetical protein
MITPTNETNVFTYVIDVTKCVIPKALRIASKPHQLHYSSRAGAGSALGPSLCSTVTELKPRTRSTLKVDGFECLMEAT